MNMLAGLLVLQAGLWNSTPSRPTVGDTIWLQRTVSVAPGWRVRAGKFESADQVEALGDPTVLAVTGGWAVRYPIVAWSPGPNTVDMPPIWRLGPDGTADSISGGTATITLASVIPDSIKTPGPQPALAPLRLARTDAIPPLVAVVLATASLVALIAWRRRGPRLATEIPPLKVDPAVPDSRWIAAGEPKAVAARASYQLRNVIAHAIPDAHEALSTSEFLAAVERARPNAPLRELRELLNLLDQVAFATTHAVDIAPVSARAHALARQFAENGKQ